MKFRETLRAEMKRRGLRAKGLAAQAELSVDTINHYLAYNGNMPNAENAYKIAQVLGVSVEYLLTGSDGTDRMRAADVPDAVRALLPRLAALSEEDVAFVGGLVERLGRK